MPKKRLLQFSICLCFSLLFVGCESKIPPLPKFQFDDVTLGDKSETLIARIYLDATLSMQGFVNPGTTHYTRIHPDIESAFTNNWPGGTVEFFRFGTRVEPISSRTDFLEAISPKFYEDSNINLETRIEKVIDFENQEVIDSESETEISDRIVDNREEAGRLVIIVTDLFQHNSDINLLVRRLTEKYIQNDLGIGLLGLRSHFRGKIYDMGPGRPPIFHESDPEIHETFRPFYLLVLGRHADIKCYFDYLTTSEFPEAQAIIFSRYMVNSLLSFDGASAGWKNLNVASFHRSGDRRLKQFSIVEVSNLVNISAKLKYVPLPYVMTTDSFTSSVAANKYTLTEQGEESPDAQRCLEVTPTLSQDELSIDFTLKPQCLANRNAIYLYKVTVGPKIDRYRIPGWCLDWNMEPTTELERDGSRPLNLKRDGSRTLNLVRFVRNISQVTAQTHDLKIANFYFYIKMF